MGKLTKNDIKHIAKLSSLTISAKDISNFQKELSSVVSYIDNLSEVDTSDIEPTSQTTGLKNILREDEIKTEDMLSVKDAVSGTENIYNNLFKVPLIIPEKKV